MAIVFHPEYDITFGGLEKQHAFDSTKYGRVFGFLQDAGSGLLEKVLQPHAVSDEDLRLVHTPRYLSSLRYSEEIAKVTELAILGQVPNKLLQENLIAPKKLATGGTILAVRHALANQWAINLSGGYHHAKADSGEGFCIFSDIAIAAYRLWADEPDVRIMIVDLDAHQGNGFASIFRDDPRTHIYDIYNEEVYPNDTDARAFINDDLPIQSGCKDGEYLSLLQKTLPKAIDAFSPELIIYNAGTDIYEEDPLGRLSVTAGGIMRRDDFVFQSAASAGVPIAMVLSGGYTKMSARIIADSISALGKSGVLVLD